MTNLGTMLIEEGIERGIEKGIERGIEKGKDEKTIEIIKNMLVEGSDLKFIQRVTGVDESRIKGFQLEPDN